RRLVVELAELLQAAHGALGGALGESEGKLLIAVQFARDRVLKRDRRFAAVLLERLDDVGDGAVQVLDLQPDVPDFGVAFQRILLEPRRRVRDGGEYEKRREETQRRPHEPSRPSRRRRPRISATRSFT